MADRTQQMQLLCSVMGLSKLTLVPGKRRLASSGCLVSVSNSAARPTDYGRHGSTTNCIMASMEMYISPNRISRDHRWS
eukprot:6213175-Pleurochrysis_carterae.AAC.3